MSPIYQTTKGVEVELHKLQWKGLRSVALARSGFLQFLGHMAFEVVPRLNVCRQSFYWPFTNWRKYWPKLWIFNIGPNWKGHSKICQDHGSKEQNFGEIISWLLSFRLVFNEPIINLDGNHSQTYFFNGPYGKFIKNPLFWNCVRTWNRFFFMKRLLMIPFQNCNQ